eukprot:151867_1
MRRSGASSLLILALCCLWPGMKVYSWMLYVVASHRRWTVEPNAAKKLFEAPDSTTVLVGRYTKGAVGWIRANTALRRWTIHSSRCRVLKKNDDGEAVTLPIVPTCSGGGSGEAAPLQNQLSFTPKISSKVAIAARTSKTVQKKVSTTDRLTDNNPIRTTSAEVKQPSRKQQQQWNSTNVTLQKKIDVGGMATPRKSKKYARTRPVENRGSAVGEDCNRSSISSPPMLNNEITANGGKKEKRRRAGGGKLKQTSQENPRKETGPFVWDPNQKQVSVIYNRSAKDVFSWITLSTHMYGPMLDRKKASSTTHEERMDWLKSWVFASDRHGVLPSDLALVLDHVKYCSNKSSAAMQKTCENENGGDPCLWPQMEEERDKKKDRRKHSRSPLVESSNDYNNGVFDSDEEDIATSKLERDETSTKDVVDDEEEDLAEDLVEEKMIFPSAVVKAEQESESSLVNLLYDAVRERLKSRYPRVIVVGDVHGCINELKELIRHVEYHPGDLLVFLGDLVCKGPDSHAVVTLARELGAVTVRGNHEYEVLRQYHLHSKGTDQDPPTKSNEHYRISQNLSIENAEWLEASPWYMKSIDLDALFVHAGLIQGVQLRKQNPRLMMNMRSILPDGTVTSKHYGEWPWARMWEGPQTVFFGHDAQRGLQIHEHGIGLDTGCVYGKKLTACVLPERQLLSVDCCKPHRTFEVSRAKQQHQQQTGPQKK